MDDKSKRWEQCRRDVEARGYNFSKIVTIARTLIDLKDREIPKRKEIHKPLTKTWSRKKKHNIGEKKDDGKRET